MIDLATASSAISVISSAVKLADGVWDSWRDFKQERKVTHEPPREHYEKIEATNDNSALVHSTNGQPAKTVTREQLSKILSKDDYEHLEALESRMRMLTGKWNGITKKIELEVNIATKTTYEMQLDDLKDKIGALLEQIMDFIERLGFHLQDHYGSMKSIAAS